MNEIKSFETFLYSLEDKEVNSEILDSLNNYLKEINLIYEDLEESEKEKYLTEFRSKINPITTQSSFGNQVILKPNGYAGDYITQEMIWHGRNGNLEVYKDKTKLGKVLTKLTYKMEAPKANEARVHFLSKILDEYQGKKIASLACGPGIEYWNKSEEFFVETDLFLLDQDKDALNSAKKNIGLSAEHIEFVQQNIFKFIVKPQEVMGKRDLIYLFGLFDYFPIKLVVKAVKKLWDCLESNGEIMFTNAIPENPTRPWMELIGDWYLDNKTTEVVLSIVPHLKGVKSIEYFIDDMKVYQYMRIRKE